MKALFNHSLHFQTEAIVPKCLRMGTNPLRINVHFTDRLHRLSNTVNRWLIKEHTSHAFDNSFNRSASTVSDHGAPRSHRFNRCDTKVLFTREEKAYTVTEQPFNFTIRDAAQKLNRRASNRFEARFIRA